MPDETLGALVQRRRLQLSMTQEQLAAAVGRSQRWMSNLETGGVKRPHFETLAALAKALELDMADLILAVRYTESEVIARRLAEEQAAYDNGESDNPKAHLRAMVEGYEWTDEQATQVGHFMEFVQNRRGS